MVSGMSARGAEDIQVHPSRRRLLAVAATVPVLVGSAPRAGAVEPARRQTVMPVPTVEADWGEVAEVLGRPGTMADGSVYRVRFTRQDLPVTTYGVRLFVGSYAAFTRYGDGRTLLMGSLSVTEAELQPAVDALHEGGLDMTAVHKHLLAHEPAMWWVHFHGHALAPSALARTLRAALDATDTTPAA
ncbi:hypothetical protein ATKI12_4172 [Kitasatospora sp. Ki12]